MAVSNVLGTLSPSAASPEMLQWAQQVSQLALDVAYLTGGIPGQPGSATQTFAGNVQFLGGGPDSGILGFSIPTVKIVRTPQQHSQGIDSALLILENVPASSQSIEWPLLVHMDSYMDSHAVGMGNVGIYSQVYKRGWTQCWGMTIEAQDFLVDPTSAMVGMEIGISYGGVDPGFGPNLNGLKDGLTIVFGDVSPNGSNPVGPTVCIGDALNIAAGANINRFHALRAINIASGCYEQAIVDMRFVHDSPFAIRFAGGPHLEFNSGTSGYSRTYWYPNAAYVPVYVGAIEIVIDGNFYYIPIASNMP